MDKRRVVLLERAHDYAESLLLQVKMSGHEAYVCFNPDECVQAAERVKANAVLLNARLPMDRVYDLGQRLRRLEHQVALILRVAQPGDQIDCVLSMESGIQFHLIKPVQPSTLLRVLRA